MSLMCRDVLLPGDVPQRLGILVIPRSTLCASTQAQAANAETNSLNWPSCAGSVCRLSLSKQISSLQQVIRIPAVRDTCEGLAPGCVSPSAAVLPEFALLLLLCYSSSSIESARIEAQEAEKCVALNVSLCIAGAGDHSWCVHPCRARRAWEGRADRHCHAAQQQQCPRPRPACQQMWAACPKQTGPP